MARLSTTLIPTDIPLAELCAAKLDGDVFPLDRGFIVSDLPETRAERAAVLAASAPPHAIAELRTAAWVLGASERPPVSHSFCVPAHERRRASLSGSDALREVVLADDDVLEINGRRVTTPLRTAIDLARLQEPWNPELRRVVRALASDADLHLADFRRHLGPTRRLARKMLALERLRVSLE